MSRFEPSDASADFFISGGSSRSLLIAFTPRSGTTLLSSGLWKTHLAGAPMEYFNPEDRAGFESRWGTLSDTDYVARLHAHRTSPNGVFSAKLHFDQLERTFRGADTLRNQAFPDPRFVFLEREDKLR
jgi:LPS sulfotransferase NodH